MKKLLVHLLYFGLLIYPFLLITTNSFAKKCFKPLVKQAESKPDPALKQAAFDILKTKCNVCHRKKNPFKIFSLKNMDKHAPKIYKQVFVYQRMPKGNEIKLTPEEYQTLKNWLTSKNIH